MIRIDGKKISDEVKAELKQEVELWVAAGNKKPHLAAILVGDNGASETYVASKIRSCEQIGFDSSLIRRDANITENELIQIIEDLNNDPEVDGFIVQLPLPDHIQVDRVIEAIDQFFGFGGVKKNIDLDNIW